MGVMCVATMFFLQRYPQFSLSVDEFTEGNSRLMYFTESCEPLITPSFRVPRLPSGVAGALYRHWPVTGFLVVIKQFCIQTL